MQGKLPLEFRLPASSPLLKRYRVEQSLPTKGIFVLVLLLVIVLERAISITITSTIRYGGLSTSTI